MYQVTKCTFDTTLRSDTRSKYLSVMQMEDIANLFVKSIFVQYIFSMVVFWRKRAETFIERVLR